MMNSRSLEAIQQDMLAALHNGPGAIVFSDFEGTEDRVLNGMKVHANTTSHARLVALEETFPRLLAEMGHARFNALSRAFLECDCAMREPLNRVGSDFPAWLDGAEGDTAAASIARFEWLWLESFHAEEREPLRLSDLAGQNEGALLRLVIGLHPAARLLMLDDALRANLEGEVPDLDRSCAILLVRPEAEVRIVPLTSTEAWIARSLLAFPSISNLLAAWAELDSKVPGDMDPAMPGLIRVIDFGAVIRGA